MKRVKYKRPRNRIKDKRFYGFFSFFSIILSFFTFFYFFLPTFGALVGLFLGFLFVIFLILPIILTLGLLLINDEFRSWVSNSSTFIHQLFNIIDQSLELSSGFIYVALSALLFNILMLIIAIVGEKKEKKGYVTKIVFTIIFLIATIIWIILYIKNGYMIMS